MYVYYKMTIPSALRMNREMRLRWEGGTRRDVECGEESRQIWHTLSKMQPRTDGRRKACSMCDWTLEYCFLPTGTLNSRKLHGYDYCGFHNQIHLGMLQALMENACAAGDRTRTRSENLAGESEVLSTWNLLPMLPMGASLPKWAALLLRTNSVFAALTHPTVFAQKRIKAAGICPCHTACVVLILRTVRIMNRDIVGCRDALPAASDFRGQQKIKYIHSTNCCRTRSSM